MATRTVRLDDETEALLSLAEGSQTLDLAIWLWLHDQVTRMPAGKFKNQCLRGLDEVAARKRPVTITKRGKPVATLVPYTAGARTTKSLAGSVLRERGSPFGTKEPWDADPA